MNSSYKTPSETLASLQSSATNEFDSTTSNISDAVNSATESVSSSFDSSSETESSTGSYIFFIFIAIVIVVIILAILGINVFVFLAKGTQSTANFVDGIVDSIFEKLDPFMGGFFSKIGKFIASIFIIGYETTLSGESAAETAGGIVAAGLTAKNGIIGNTSNTNLQSSEWTSDETQQSSQQGSQQQQQSSQQQEYNNEQQKQNQQNNQSYIPVESTSSSGWCYVGEDRGYRSCLEINPSTTGCTSGQLYSSQQQCIKK